MVEKTNEHMFSGEMYYTRINPPDPGNAKIKANRTVSLVISDKDALLATSLGLKVYPPTESIPGKHIKPKSVVENETEKRKAVVVDEDGNLWPKETLIGNGTRGNVLVVTGYNERGILKVAQVVDLVPYEGEERETDPATRLAILGATALKRERGEYDEKDTPDPSTPDDPDDEIPV